MQLSGWGLTGQDPLPPSLRPRCFGCSPGHDPGQAPHGRLRARPSPPHTAGPSRQGWSSRRGSLRLGDSCCHQCRECRSHRDTTRVPARPGSSAGSSGNTGGHGGSGTRGGSGHTQPLPCPPLPCPPLAAAPHSPWGREEGDDRTGTGPGCSPGQDVPLPRWVPREEALPGGREEMRRCSGVIPVCIPTGTQRCVR